MRHLTRQGGLIEEEGQTYLHNETEESALTPLQAAATRYRIGLGPRRGKKILTLRTLDPESDSQADLHNSAQHCAQSNGFSLHAGVSCKAHERTKLERLCRYVALPAIANERLKLTASGEVVVTLKTPYRESLPREHSECFGYGTTHLIMSPPELLQRRAAIIPRPRIHLIRYHGILVPNAKGRAQVIPKQPSEQIENIAPPAGINHEQEQAPPNVTAPPGPGSSNGFSILIWSTAPTAAER